MIKYNDQKKDKINILLNIDNYYGKHTGGMGRVLLFGISVCAPFLIYTFVFVNIIPFKWFLIPFIPYTIIMALRIIGRETERTIAYLKQLNDEYATAKELIKIMDIHEDGLVEYNNGTICYIIQAYGYSYFNDNKYSKDLEEFLSAITTKYEVDIYGHLVVEELETSKSDLEKLSVYNDQEILKERLEFYKYQDKFTNNNSKLYRLNFVVKSYKNKWGRLSKDIRNLVNSEIVQCFSSVKICNREEAIDVISRDCTLYVDLGEMLRNKHDVENFFGSKVLYFGDDIPEDMKPEDYDPEVETDRRVIEELEEETEETNNVYQELSFNNLNKNNNYEEDYEEDDEDEDDEDEDDRNNYHDFYEDDNEEYDETERRVIIE